MLCTCNLQLATYNYFIMIIATYNINSVRIRQKALQSVVSKANPDILCLQETKVDDPLFPLEDMKKLGFEYIHFSGQKSYNGVALLSRVPLSDIKNQPIINEDRRHISARLKNGVEIHNFYVPAGGDIPDPKVNPKFDHKLKFVDHMTDWANAIKKDKRDIVIVGDMNIAPLEHDVWSHKQLLTVVSHTPIETEKFEKFRNTLGWVDTSRHFVPPTEKLYSWWSYRNHDWAKSNRGRRLDHIWITPGLKPSLKSSHILREARDFENPSDHVPVVTELDI